jgi:integrase
VDLATARKKARQVQITASEGLDPRAVTPGPAPVANTFDAVVAKFIKQEAEPNIASWRNVERVLRMHVTPHFRGKEINRIRRADVHKLLDGLIASASVATAREARKHLSRVFSWSVDREMRVDNPILGLRRKELRPNLERGRALSDHELQAIWRACDGMGYPFGSLYQLLLLTGQRLREWADCQWSEINLKSRLLEIPRGRSKGRRDHLIPLSEKAAQICDALPRWLGPFAFSTRDGRRPVSGFSGSKRQLDELVGERLGGEFRPFRIHDFRVTCETRLAALGFSRDDRDAVLGHAKAGLQRNYNKYDYLEQKRQALESYARHLAGVIQ